MSLNISSRRALGTRDVIKCLQSTVYTAYRPALHPFRQQRRGYKLSNLVPGFLRRRKAASPSQTTALGDLADPKIRKAALKPKTPNAASVPERFTKGRLESDSIFDDELTSARRAATTTDLEQSDKSQKSLRRHPRQRTQKQAPSDGLTSYGLSVVQAHIAPTTDPDPRARERWQRKKIITHVTRSLDPSDKETRTERISRTERTHDSFSPLIGTSTKKLVHLARQIRGKTIDDALVQMRFSRKKNAREVVAQLLEARDHAVVQRGMGLGGVKVNADGAEGADGEMEKKTEEKVTKVQTKDGKWVTITDPTQMYISEAWVGTGPTRGMRMLYHARGKASRAMKPTATINIRVKEQKTRIREHEERKAKELKRGLWIHLPDRPVTSQRPYYSW